MPDHQGDEEPIKRRLRLDQEGSSLAGVKVPPSRKDDELVDKWLAKAKKSLNGVAQ